MHAMALQDALRRSWLEGVEGRLCGREQAKAWALREVWIDHGKDPYGKQVEALRARERSVEIAGKRREVVALLAPLQSALAGGCVGQIGAVDESV